jgi:serine/threonine-protein kinase
MSPEHKRGDELDGRTDIFSLGVVACELLLGRPPYPGGATEAELHDTDLGVLDALPPQTAATLRRALADALDDRWRTAAELGVALQAAIGADARQDEAG